MIEPELTEEQVRVIAVDWSGAIDGAKRKIWLAESDGVSITRLECGRTRAELIEHLITTSRENPRFVVGLDFAFSFPEWFLRERGLGSALDLWSLAEQESECWLKECSAPFWGRKGTKRTRLDRLYCRTELAAPAIKGIRPKSVFQVNGPGAVGTGSLRGLHFLKRLHEAGFSVWPFDPPGWPKVVEIYPRLLTGSVNKSSRNELHQYLLSRGFELDPGMLSDAGSCDDAFDALVSAVRMAEEWQQLSTLMPIADPQVRLEGLIWHSQWRDTLRIAGV